MTRRDEEAPSDDGIVAEDITQLVEHIELTGEQHIGSGPEWELALPTDETRIALHLADDETQQLPDLQGFDAAADNEQYTSTEINIDQLLQAEDEKLELEWVAALTAERERWQQRVEGMRKEMTERERQFAEGAQEIEGLSSRLSSLAIERQQFAGQSDPATEHWSPADGVIASLHGRLHERSRALLEARQEIARLQATREQLVAGIAARDQFIRQMRAQLRALDATDQGGGELRKFIHHFFGGEQPAAAPAAISPAAEAQTPEEPPAPTAAPETSEAPSPRQVVVEDMQPPVQTPVSARSEPRLRRYLIGLDMVGSVYEMTLPRINIGRTRDNDLRIVDPTVSRLHAVLKTRGREVSVIDANSSNGVFVNGIQLRYAKLEDGDTLTFGAVRFRYRVGSGSSGGDFKPD